MREITYAEAIREALVQAMRRDADVFLMGEDVGDFGGLWGVSQGLRSIFGEERVRDTPVSEGAIVGAALGAALMGMRPVVEITSADFLMSAADQIVNQVAKARSLRGGKWDVPLVIRIASGAVGAAGAQLSQSLEACFMHVPGLKIVLPATPADAKGLLVTALQGSDPVLFFEPKTLYTEKGPVPEEEDFSLPFGQAAVLREGHDVTLIAIGGLLKKALFAATQLEKEGISVEVIDPRTLVPLDKQCLIRSVAKTSRVVIAHEAHLRAGPGAEIAAILAEEAIEYLDGPILRVGAKNVPVPYSPVLENFVLPDVADIVAAIKRFWKS